MKAFIICLCLLFSNADFGENCNLYENISSFDLERCIEKPSSENVELMKDNFLKTYDILEKHFLTSYPNLYGWSFSEKDIHAFRLLMILKTEKYKTSEFCHYEDCLIGNNEFSKELENAFVERISRRFNLKEERVREILIEVVNGKKQVWLDENFFICTEIEKNNEGNEFVKDIVLQSIESACDDFYSVNKDFF